MPFDGSGNFNRVMNWISDAAANIKIVASRHDQEDDNFASGLSNVITKDGQTQPTANIPMNGKKLVNLGAPTVATDASTKGYVDGLTNFATGITLPASAPNAAIRFTDADIGFGARKTGVPAGTVNRFVWNDKADLSGADIATLTEIGDFTISGKFAAASISVPVFAVAGASAQVAIKPTAGNGHVWWYAADGVATRMILYTASGAQGPGILNVGAVNYNFGQTGVFAAPAGLMAGSTTFQTNGNISGPNPGSIWLAWGAADAYSAISARIEDRALAWANSRVSALQYRKVSQGSSGGATSFVAPAGAVLNGFERETGVSGQLKSCYFMYLQVYDPVRGWVGFTG